MFIGCSGSNSSALYMCISGADPGGAPGARAPLTLGFEAPKLSILGPYLIFLIFFASLRSAYYFFNMLLFKVQIQNFPASLRSAYDFSPRSLCFSLSFTHFRLLGVHLSLSFF